MLLRGYTVVLKSEGEIANNQADVLGVYRMVDSHCHRPVYKQDAGENYIYYSGASASWLVGCVVGHHHAWLRNATEKAPSTRWVPDLTSGWEHRALPRPGELPPAGWAAQDGTFRIEPLPEAERLVGHLAPTHVSSADFST